MLKISSKFQIFRSEKVPFPKAIKYDTHFWCSFNTEKQLIMCRVNYSGEDEIMLERKWYKGLIELPYGDMFPPFGKQFEEEIYLNYLYELQIASQVIGECVFDNFAEVNYNDFAVKESPEDSI